MVLAGAAVAGNGNDGDGENGNGCDENCGQGQGGNGGDGGNGGAGGASDVDQEQGQFQAQGNSQSLTIEDAKNPASSAANLYLSQCTSGASAQGFGGGGSVGGPDEVCLLLNLAVVANGLGDTEASKAALTRASKILTERTNPFLRFLQMFPVIRRVI